jgi:hypothetical protein
MESWALCSLYASSGFSYIFIHIQVSIQGSNYYCRGVPLTKVLRFLSFGSRVRTYSAIASRTASLDGSVWRLLTTVLSRLTKVRIAEIIVYPVMGTNEVLGLLSRRRGQFNRGQKACVWIQRHTTRVCLPNTTLV